MSMSRKLACLIMAAGLVVATGDRLAPVTAHARVEARHTALAGSNLPTFPIFGWVSPPLSETTSERFRELAAAGFNLALPAINDTGGLADSRTQLDVAAENGVKCLVWDSRFERIALGLPGTYAELDTLLDAYRDHPAVAGYYLGDEPPPNLFDLLAVVHQAFRELDPANPGWNNLPGRAGFGSIDATEDYTREYASRIGPAILCNDHYEFTPAGDRDQFMENAAMLNRLSREWNVPFWAIVLLVEHTGFRRPTEGELKWQVSHLLAYGADGIGYFTYWTPKPNPPWLWGDAVIDVQGRRTEFYDMLAAFNPRVSAAGETLAGLTWMLTEHAGSVPTGGRTFVSDEWIDQVEGRAAIGQFVDANDGRYLLVVNSDSLNSQTVGLRLPGTRSVRRLGSAPGDWRFLVTEEIADAQGGTGVAVDVSLEAGDFALLQLSGNVAAALVGGSSPGLLVAPNPARGALTFSIAAALHGATLEILDAGGRRVWSRALPGGSATVRWNGVLDSGEHASAGVYFTRLEDRRGANVQRVVWLGP